MYHFKNSSLSCEGVMVGQLHVTNARRGKLESSYRRAVVQVVGVHGQQVLEAVTLHAPRFPPAVRHEVTGTTRRVTQIDGHSLRHLVRLHDHLPLARGVPRVPGPDEAQFRVANLLLLVLVGLPTPTALLSPNRRFRRVRVLGHGVVVAQLVQVLGHGHEAVIHELLAFGHEVAHHVSRVFAGHVAESEIATAAVDEFADFVDALRDFVLGRFEVLDELVAMVVIMSVAVMVIVMVMMTVDVQLPRLFLPQRRRLKKSNRNLIRMHFFP